MAPLLSYTSQISTQVNNHLTLRLGTWALGHRSWQAVHRAAQSGCFVGWDQALQRCSLCRITRLQLWPLQSDCVVVHLFGMYVSAVWSLTTITTVLAHTLHSVIYIHM